MHGKPCSGRVADERSKSTEQNSARDRAGIDVYAWYFGWGPVGASVVLGLGVYGFVRAIGGQRFFREGFRGEE